MREILFRGKWRNNGLWIEGDLRQYPSGAKSIKSEEFPHIIEVDPATVSQFTGLKDKNGQRIFEGDIVETVLPPSVSQPSFAWPNMPVVFADGVFGLQDHRGGVTPFKSFAPRVTFEVKGNIHDNPELLK